MKSKLLLLLTTHGIDPPWPIPNTFAQADGDEIVITNPGFESGTTGWTVTVSDWIDGIGGSITSVVAQKFSGSKSAKVNLYNSGAGSSGYARATQAVALEADTYYQFRARILGNYDDSSCQIYIDLTSADGLIIRRLVKLGGNVNGWNHYLLNFKTGIAQDWTINFRLNGPVPGINKSFYVDDIAIQKITTLATADWTLGAIGDSQVSHLGIDAHADGYDNHGSWLTTSIRRAQIERLIRIIPLNKGVAGNTTAQVLVRVQADIVEQVPKPAICYVAVGTNDVQAGRDLDLFQADMEAILQTLLDGSVTPILFTITPRKDAYASLVPAYNARITAAATAKSVLLFDAYTIFQTYPGYASMFDDALHYSQIGHSNLGRSLGETLLTLI